MKKLHFEYKWFIWLGLISLFAYVVYRATTFSFTHDESLSYSITQGVTYQRSTANNHVLNTFLMDWSSRFFGKSELAFRLPNVLAFGIYLFAIFLLLKKKNSWLLFLGASLLCLNPYLLEYFSLARGYGLSLGFMLMSLFFTLSIDFSLERNKQHFSDYFLAILFAALATNANLSMINYFIALLGLFSIHFLYSTIKGKSSRFTSYLPFVILMLVAATVIFFEAQRLFLLQERKELYFGEESMANMFQSIALSSIYTFDYFSWTIQGTKYFVLTSLLLGAILMVWKREMKSPLNVVWALLLFILIGLTLESVIFKSKYPSGRSALFFVPLFSLYLFYLLEKIQRDFKLKSWLFVPLTALLILPILVNFYFSTKRTATKDWEFDAETKEMMAFLKSETKQKNHPSTIANHWLFEPSINYYIESQKINLAPATRNPIDFTTDYIYRLEDDSKVEGYEVVLEFPKTKTNLLRRVTLK